MKIHLIIIGIILIAIVLLGCYITRGIEANLSNQSPLSPQQSPISVVSGMSFDDNPYCNETLANWGNLSGTTSPTVCFDYGGDTRFELTHGIVTIERNNTLDVRQSYIVTTNMTLTNTGLTPIEVNYATVELKDDVGDGCFSKEYFECGVILFGPEDKDQEYWLYPGNSETQPLNVTLFSSKSLEGLSSQKFVLEGVFSNIWKAPDGSTPSCTGGRRDWMIDLNQTESH